MSYPERPAYQKTTKSSSSPSVTPVRRNNNSGSVPLVRGLSPVRSPYYGRATQELETQRSHNNPLFNAHTLDAGDRRSGRQVHDNVSVKPIKDSKENLDKEEPWKVHVEKGQYGGKTHCTTPGKTSTRVAPMQFTTPPKPVVKRKILADNNRDSAKATTSSARRGEESRVEKEVGSARTQEESRVEKERKAFEPFSSEETGELEAPKTNIEELQKRIQRFLHTEGPAQDFPLSPEQCTESIRRFSNIVCGGSPEPTVEDVAAPYHPVFSPYSPRPEFLRARTRSPSPAVVDGDEEDILPHEQSPIPTLEKSTTPTSYDPKNNFLSPRPQFLRYRPLRRLELLRRSADALLDLDLDSPAADGDSVKVESEKGDYDYQDSQSTDSEVLEPFSLAADVVEEGVEESKPEELELKLEDGKPTKDECDFHNGISAECELKRTECESGDSTLSEENGEAVARDSSQVESRENKVDVLETPDEDAVDTEEDEDVEHLSSFRLRVFRTLLSFILVVGFAGLVLVASGSPGLLPTRFHGNELSTFWRTNEHVEPARKFMQTIEGPWKESPDFLGYPVNKLYMKSLQGDLKQFVEDAKHFDRQKVVNSVKEFYSVSSFYIAPVVLYLTQSYSNVKTWVKESADSYISKAPQVDEWDWVPDYDFVVAKDVFDPTEAYEAILSRMESLELKSLFQTYLGSGGAKRLTELVEDNSVANDRDDVTSSTGSTLLEADGGDQVTESSGPDSPVEVFESPYNQFTQESVEGLGSDEAEGDLVLGSLEQENNNEFFGSSATGELVTDISVSPPLVIEIDGLPTVTGSFKGKITTTPENDVNDVDLKVDEQDDGEVISLNSSGSELDMVGSFDTVEARSAEAVQQTLEQSPQESTTIVEEVLANQDTADPQELKPQEAGANAMLLDKEPKLSRSSLLPRLRLDMSPAAAFVGLASMSIGLVMAVVLMGPARRYISQLFRRPGVKTKSKRGVADANIAQTVKDNLPRKPERTFRTFNTTHAGANYLPGDSPLPTNGVSSELTEHFQSPSRVSEKTYTKTMLDRVSLLSPEKTFKQGGDKDSYMTPDDKIVEDSSLGRFTAMVPVIHNEGTENEEVKLTPVRRSSRIRSRLLSPSSSTLSHFSYSPEL